MVSSLYIPLGRTYSAYVMTTNVGFTEALEAAPGSVRELAREAGLSESLLRHVRDGRRRLTPETGDAVAAALRRWSERCRTAAEVVDSAVTETRRRDG